MGPGDGTSLEKKKGINKYLEFCEVCSVTQICDKSEKRSGVSQLARLPLLFHLLGDSVTLELKLLSEGLSFSWD